MPKSAIDATRFTSTTPHASAKTSAGYPSSNPSAIPNRAPGPLGETPQQKVKRLRDAAARVRDAKISTFDKFVIRGRVWADRAHRFTALTLIGLTGVAGVVTVYALGDMIIYNRRKRREYFAEQAAIRDAAYYEAYKAVRYGKASEEQIILVEQNQMERRAAQEGKSTKGPGIMARVKGLLFSGLDKEGVKGYEIKKKEGEVTLGAEDEGALEGSLSTAVRERQAEVKGGIGSGSVDETSGAFAREAGKEREAQSRGGPLDRLGTSIADKEEQKQNGGWLTFMTRK